MFTSYAVKIKRIGCCLLALAWLLVPSAMADLDDGTKMSWEELASKGIINGTRYDNSDSGGWYLGVLYESRAALSEAISLSGAWMLEEPRGLLGGQDVNSILQEILDDEEYEHTHYADIKDQDKFKMKLGENTILYIGEGVHIESIDAEKNACIYIAGENVHIKKITLGGKSVLVNLGGLSVDKLFLLDKAEAGGTGTYDVTRLMAVPTATVQGNLADSPTIKDFFTKYEKAPTLQPVDMSTKTDEQHDDNDANGNTGSTGSDPQPPNPQPGETCEHHYTDYGPYMRCDYCGDEIYTPQPMH